MAASEAAEVRPASLADKALKQDNSRPRSIWYWVLQAALIATAVVILVPDLLAVQGFNLLGNTRDKNVDFLTRLVHAVGESFWMAAAGTTVVLIGSVLLGLAQGGMRSGRALDLPMLLTSAAVSIPDLALLIALRAAWPEQPTPLGPTAAVTIVRGVSAMGLLVSGWLLTRSLGPARRRLLRGLAVAAAIGVLLSPASATLTAIREVAPALHDRPSPATFEWLLNLAILLLLAVLAMPVPSRLIASRVRSLRGRLFVTASRNIGASSPVTFRREMLPHLVEDIAWVAALTFPRFIHIEVGLAYLGLAYRRFDGLGQVLMATYDYRSLPRGMTQLLIVVGVLIWLSLLPQLVLRQFGLRLHSLEKDA
jgi:ABC-type dipeptide/oligopeptide/nickel transport system permease subunit